MKSLISTLLSLSFIFGSMSQQQFENGTFENWENVGSATEEPTDWSSLKTADALASTAPKVISRDAGRNGGYCPKLEVKEVFGIKANGIMTCGRVHADFNPENGYVFTDSNDPQWHTPFTSRPDSIVGWYKYSPQNGDKGKIEVVLHVSQGNLPYNGTFGNMVGRAKFEFTSAQANWTRFSKAFDYFNTQDPAYLLAVVTSGDSTVSQTGSTLWIDDISLIYNTSGVNTEEDSREIAVNGSNGFLYFDTDDTTISYSVYDVSGKIIQEGIAAPKVEFIHESGIYLIRIETANGVFTKKLYIR
ncbi:MAG: PCMD domain-containing protein [Brumimicrobium sp.]|nr:PCMD domain-containing protein [Brumimicrobium sp.]